MSSIDLGRPVGVAHPPFMIAALDCGKLAALEGALAAVDAAADASCDAVKLTQLPWSWASRVIGHAADRRVKVIAAATDERAVERLDWLGVTAIEVFFDWSDVDLIVAAARTGRPLVLSVANASPIALDEAVTIARREGQGGGGLALVQRVITNGLEALTALHEYDTVVGISDRSAGSSLVHAAIRGGARIVEKRLRPRALGPELAAMVRDADLAWATVAHRAADAWSTN